MNIKTQTSYKLELNATEYATFIAAINIINREKLEKYFGKFLDENIYDILIACKSSILQTLEHEYETNKYLSASEIIKKVLTRD